MQQKLEKTTQKLYDETMWGNSEFLTLYVLDDTDSNVILGEKRQYSTVVQT